MATIQEITAALATLTDLMGSNAQTTSSSSSFTKPESYKGKSADDARRFLAQFKSWASEKAELQNDEIKRIKAALQLCADDAGVWATRFLDRLNNPVSANNPAPFSGWNDFETTFKARWYGADDEAEAIAKLKRLKQGTNQSMSEHSARFLDLAGRTKFEEHALQTMFVDSITPQARTMFAMGRAFAPEGQKLDSLDKIIAFCQRADYDMNNPSLGIGRGSQSRSHHDPNTMQIDAVRTGGSSDDFQNRMRGRCYGCGQSGHRTKDDQCRAKNISCRYCNKPGHFENVCRDKFLGRQRGGNNRPRGGGRFNRGGGHFGQQRIAASNTPFSLFDEPIPDTVNTVPMQPTHQPTPVPDQNSNQNALITDLMDKVNTMYNAMQNAANQDFQ